MRKIIPAVLLAVLLVTPSLVLGQTHTVSLGWQASTTTGVSYNVYRAPCTGTISTSNVCSAEGTFAKIGNATTLTYVDSTVAAGSNYSYYVTALCGTTGCPTGTQGESAASNHIGAAIPFNAPAPPGNLAITSVARYTNPDGSTGIVAKWEGVPNMKMTYAFYGNGKVLTSATVSNASGVYQANWTGTIKTGASVGVEICAANGACSSKLI